MPRQLEDNRIGGIVFPGIESGPQVRLVGDFAAGEQAMVVAAVRTCWRGTTFTAAGVRVR